jgi:hypothetical protein
MLVKMSMKKSQPPNFGILRAIVSELKCYDTRPNGHTHG